MSSSDEATIGLFQIVFKHIHETQKKKFLILDTGSGLGKNGLFLKHFSWRSNIEICLVGIDIWKPHLKVTATANIYNALIAGDLRFLPFKPQSFDIIIMSEVLEHLPKSGGYKLLTFMEQLLNEGSIIVLTTPQGYQPQEELRGNPYEKHRSIWQPGELREFGYIVNGTPLVIKIWRGMFFLTGCSISESFKRKLFNAFLFMMAALSFFLPNFSGKIIAYKVVKRRGHMITEREVHE